MSKKFFRPPPEAFEEESEEDSDEEEQIPSATSNRTSAASNSVANANLSSDEEDSDDAGGDDGTTNKRKKSGFSSSPPKKKSKAASFFDMEAEASDDEDEDDYGNKDGEQMDEETRELIRQQDRRRAGLGQFGERSVAEISREIENRHRMQSRRVDRSVLLDRAVPEARAKSRPKNIGSALANGASSAIASVGPTDEVTEEEVGYTQAVAQQSLMPSVSDPSFWMVSCQTGKEQELVFQIMNKCAALARQGRPLGISAAIAAQSKGKIYIESFNEPSVMEAIQGVRGLLQYTMRLVPIGDMTTVSKWCSAVAFCI